MPADQQSGDDPAFRAAVAELEAAVADQRELRPEVSFDGEPPPRRLATHAAAVGATVHAEGTEIGWGRFVLLYDPVGQEGWAGPFRVIAYVRAALEPEIAADPLVGQVGWSWLTEALESRAADYAAPSGTVTRVVTEGFGAKQDEADGDRVRDAGIMVAGHDAGQALRSGPAPRCVGGHALPGRRPASAPARRRSAQAAAIAAAAREAPLVSVPLLEPREGLPPLIVTAADLADATARLSEGTGPRCRRRRAGIRVPVRAPGFPRAAQKERRGHGADRPDRVPRPVRARRRARRYRGRAARGQSGSALPGRSRFPAAPPLRHRAGRPAARLSAGRPRHARGRGARADPGEDALRRGLVYEAVAARSG